MSRNTVSALLWMRKPSETYQEWRRGLARGQPRQV